MLADWILRLIGEPPAAYPDPLTKWAAIFAFATDQIVPYGQIVLFLLPFLAIWLVKKWHFTWRALVLATIVGALLAWSAYWFDQWLLLWGAGQAFEALYGSPQ